MKKIRIGLVIAILLGVFAGCRKEKHKVDYHGLIHIFTNAEESYSGGTKVTLISALPVNSHTPVFMLDDKQLDVKMNQDKEITVSFIMPDHDVSLRIILNTDIDDGVLLANYYECIRTSESFSSYELVVKSSNFTDKLIVEVFENEEGIRQCSSYLVDSEILQQCYEICVKFQTDQWSKEENLTSIDGKQCVYKYLYKGKIIRITTDEMIGNGMDFFQQIKSVLQNSINQSTHLDE